MSNLAPKEGKISVEITDAKRDQDHYVYSITTKHVKDDGTVLTTWTCQHRYSECLKLYESLKSSAKLEKDFPPKKGFFSMSCMCQVDGDGDIQLELSMKESSRLLNL